MRSSTSRSAARRQGPWPYASGSTGGGWRLPWASGISLISSAHSGARSSRGGRGTAIEGCAALFVTDRPSLDADGHRAQVRRALVLDGDGDLAPAPPVQVPEGRSGPAPQDEEEAMALRVLQTKTIFLDDGDGA